MGYPLVICYIAIENGPFSSLIYPLKMVTFKTCSKPPASNGLCKPNESRSEASPWVSPHHVGVILHHPRALGIYKPTNKY